MVFSMLKNFNTLTLPKQNWMRHGAAEKVNVFNNYMTTDWRVSLATNTVNATKKVFNPKTKPIIKDYFSK